MHFRKPEVAKGAIFGARYEDKGVNIKNCKKRPVQKKKIGCKCILLVSTLEMGRWYNGDVFRIYNSCDPKWLYKSRHHDILGAILK